MTETFIGRLQVKNRVVIPPNYITVLKLKQGDKIRVTIEKIQNPLT